MSRVADESRQDADRDHLSREVESVWAIIHDLHALKHEVIKVERIGDTLVCYLAYPSAEAVNSGAESVSARLIYSPYRYQLELGYRTSERVSLHSEARRVVEVKLWARNSRKRTFDAVFRHAVNALLAS